MSSLDVLCVPVLPRTVQSPPFTHTHHFNYVCRHFTVTIFKNAIPKYYYIVASMDMNMDKKTAAGATQKLTHSYTGFQSSGYSARTAARLGTRLRRTELAIVFMVSNIGSMTMR